MNISNRVLLGILSFGLLVPKPVLAEYLRIQLKVSRFRLRTVRPWCGDCSFPWKTDSSSAISESASIKTDFAPWKRKSPLSVGLLDPGLRFRVLANHMI